MNTILLVQHVINVCFERKAATANSKKSAKPSDSETCRVVRLLDPDSRQSRLLS